MMPEWETRFHGSTDLGDVGYGEHAEIAGSRQADNVTSSFAVRSEYIPQALDKLA